MIRDRLADKNNRYRAESPRKLIMSFTSYGYEEAPADSTIGTGITDDRNQPINLVKIPNEAVVSVHYTERTSPEAVKLIRDRLADKNNRYRAESPRKLIMSFTSYGYEEAPADN